MTSAQPSPPRPARFSPALTALAAVLAGFGLGSLALGLARPVPEVAVLPPPAMPPQNARPAEAPALEPAPGTRPWPAAFGEPLPPAPPRAEPEEQAPPRATPPPPEPEPEYILRGIVTDPEGGWVLAEGPQGIELVRLGERFSGGERVTEITRQGVVLESFGEFFLIEFEEDVDGEPGARRSPPTQERHADDDEFDDDDESDDDYLDDRPRIPATRGLPGGAIEPRTP